MLVQTFENYSNKVTIEYVKGGPLHWSNDTKTFSGEISELSQICPQLRSVTPKEIDVKDKLTGSTVSYKFTKADMDGSNEDTYGWNFESTNGKFKSYFLLIND